MALRTLDTAGEWRFWTGFRLENGAWAPFRRTEKTLVLAPPEGIADSVPVAIASPGAGGFELTGVRLKVRRPRRECRQARAG